MVENKLAIRALLLDWPRCEKNNTPAVPVVRGPCRLPEGENSNARRNAGDDQES